MARSKYPTNVKLRLDDLHFLFERFNEMEQAYQYPLYAWSQLCESFNWAAPMTLNNQFKRRLAHRLIAWRSIPPQGLQTGVYIFKSPFPNHFVVVSTVSLRSEIFACRLDSLITGFAGFWRIPFQVGLDQINRPRWQELREQGIVKA